jgi:hypothetical protein
MAWTSLTAFYPLVTPELQGCPQALILQSARKIITEFCRKTRSWEFDLDPIFVRDGKVQYDIDLDSSEVVIDEVRRVFLQDTELSANIDFIMLSPALLELIQEPTEDIDGGLEIRVALRPSMTATTIDDQFYNEWAYPLADGIKSDLMAMPKKPWSDLNMSAYYRKSFYTGITKAKNQTATGGAVNQSISFGG